MSVLNGSNPSEGKITLCLEINGGQVASVQLKPRPVIPAARALHGRPMTEAVQMVPRIFSLCGTAQASAAAQACEQAATMESAAGIAERRQALVDMESLREHLWRILLDWPAFYGDAAQREVMAGAMQLAADYRTALTGKSDPFVPGAAAVDIDHARAETALVQLGELLQRSIFALPLDEWLATEEQERLADWVQQHDTIATRLLGELLQQGWSGSGACDIAALPPMASQQLAQLMVNDAFIEQPQWQGGCCETGTLPRNDTPLLRSLQRDYGNGLLSRFTARLTEVARLWQKLTTATGEAESMQPLNLQHIGIGQVAAARGQLVHRVELENDKIRDYRILAPTEWNFHPQGVVSKALANLRGDAHQIEQQARLLINAIDPCVGYELQIQAEVAHA